VGDLVGNPGRRVVRKLLPGLVDRHHVDFCIVNVENAAGGFGITAEVMGELEGLPIDCYTSGNHIWDKKEAMGLLDADPRILRPATYPAGNPGKGLFVGESAAGVPVAVINLEGQVFMRPLDSPFREADRLLASLRKEVKVVVVDFHAEATSEKLAMGFHLDGRVSLVVGTHTHVPTADERVFPKGTAFLCDVGMTGPYESIIGFQAERVLHRFLMHTPSSFEVAKRDVRLAAVLVDVDENSGHASAIERMLIPEAEA
jgi:metallophosphoesterase (TIGR00282 family)